MRRNWIIGVVCACLLLFAGANAGAVNMIEIPSQNLDPNQTGVDIRAFVTNDIELKGIILPVVFRTVSGTAEITSLQLLFRDRLDPSLSVLSEIKINNIFDSETGTCKGGSPGGFASPPVFADTLSHAIGFAPVGIQLVRNRLFSPPLTVGADTEGSFSFLVDIGAGQGIFELDTTCTDPANHLAYIRESDGQSQNVDFTKGVFTVGNPPVARDTSWSTDEDVPKNVAYLPASDPDPGPLTFALNDGPFNGQISAFDANTGAFTYTPDPEYSGADSIKFEASDGIFSSNEGTVRITVVSVNDPPVAYDTALVTDEDIPVNGQVFGADIDGPTLTFEVSANPPNGTLTSFDPNTGVFTYEPDLNYNGNDAFTFRARDGITVSPLASVQITINPTNDPPVARDSSISTPFEVPVNGQFHSSDVDGPAPTYVHLTGPFHGMFDGFNPSTGEFLYTPDTSFSGADSITFEVTDGLLSSNVGTIRISVSTSDCVCKFWGDPTLDGTLDAQDLNQMIAVLFFGALPSKSVFCNVADADVNCDCFLDAQDLNTIIDALFFGIPYSCDPCGAVCGPPE